MMTDIRLFERGETLNRIKELRQKIGMTQKTLADSAQISQPYLFDLENNRRGARSETLERIAKALGVSVDDLLIKNAS